MIQKIIKVGNSAAVTIPKSFLKKSGWAVGDELVVEGDAQTKLLLVKEKGSSYNTKITPEFKQWLDEIGNKYADVIKALAKI